jgi:hypothetical protein
MRSALLVLFVIAALLATSLSVAAQTPDTDTPVTDTPIVDEPVFDQPLADQELPVDQDSPDATSTPAVIYAVVTATPTPTVAPTNTPATYTTRNGPKSEQDLRTELARAGYQGPWDLGALLTAYDRATAPTATPVPTRTPTPVPAPVRATLDPALASRCFQFAFDTTAAVARTAVPGHGAELAQGMVAIQNGCQQAATEHGSFGESCYEFAISRSFQAAIQGAAAGVSPSLVDTLYRNCLGGWGMS